MHTWTKKELDRLSNKRLFVLCQDKRNWQKDLLRSPAPPSRCFLDPKKTQFEQVVFFNEEVFWLIPQKRPNYRITLKVELDGNLAGDYYW